MPSVNEVLDQTREEYPQWLQNAEQLNTETLANFVSSRVVYYPGAGCDGRAIAIFGQTHSAHCFVHIDLTTTSQKIRQQLQPTDPDHCAGYSPVFQSEFTADELTVLLRLEMSHPFPSQKNGLKSALWTVLERDRERSDDHGPKRLAFLHIQAEAVWACRNIWAKPDHNPFAVVLQDYGFGGQWARFGGNDAPLCQMAQETVLPEFLLVAKNTEQWPNYEAVSEWTHRVDGHRNRLFRRVKGVA